MRMKRSLLWYIQHFHDCLLDIRMAISLINHIWPASRTVLYSVAQYHPDTFDLQAYRAPFADSA